ncbi:hypothetical protein EV1_000962 [Malus domestica]
MPANEVAGPHTSKLHLKAEESKVSFPISVSVYYVLAVTTTTTKPFPTKWGRLIMFWLLKNVNLDLQMGDRNLDPDFSSTIAVKMNYNPRVSESFLLSGKGNVGVRILQLHVKMQAKAMQNSFDLPQDYSLLLLKDLHLDVNRVYSIYVDYPVVEFDR